MSRSLRPVLTLLVLLLLVTAPIISFYPVKLSDEKARTGHIDSTYPIPEDYTIEPDTSKEEPRNLVELTFQFEFPEPQFIEDNEYLRIEMPGSYIFIEGKPQLPKFTRWLTMPRDTELTGSELKGIETFEIDIQRDILPVPLSQPHLENSAWAGAQHKYYDGERFSKSVPEPYRDEEVYDSSTPYPSSWYEVRKGMGRDPETDEISLFLVVDFFPVRYSPASGILIIATTAVVKLSIASTESREGAPRSGPGTDMVLIGPENLRNAATPLADHKTSTGLDTLYVSLDDIYNSVYFPVQGANNPEKIKYFIRDALENWGIVYVLLVGDSDVCPVRYARVPDGYDDNGAAGLDGVDVPCDAYYADIYNGSGDFCDWNANGNGRYGEENDECDMYYDVYVGRLPTGNGAELTDMVDDIIHYENNTMGADWFLNANLHGMDTFTWAPTAEGEYTLDQIADSGYLAGFDISKYYETQGTLSKTAIVNGLNAGAGFAAFSDHGDHHCWGATGEGDGLFDRNDAAALTNGNMLPVVTFDACLCGSFDNELATSYWTENPGESISEKLLLNENGGAIAVISATRVGWGDGGTNYAKHRSGYLGIHLYKSFQEGKRTPGRMLAGSVAYYMTEVGDDDDKDHKTLTEYGLLGDPSLAIGGLPLEVSMTGGNATIKPGSNGVFTFRVKNVSPFGENIDVDFSRLPTGFQGSASQNIPVIPGGTTNITVSIEPPRGLAAGTSYGAPVGIVCRGRGEFFDAECKIGEEYGVSLTSPLTEDTTDPGAKIPFWIELINDGNVQDTFELSFLENLSGWSIWAQSGNITVPAFDSSNITIYIQPSNLSLYGTRRITVAAVSLGSNRTVMATLKFNITIRRIYEFKVDDIPNIQLLPGENTLLDISINNTGNGKERFDIEITGRPENWTANLKEFYVEIEAYSQRSATLEIFVPTDALASDDYEVYVHISSNAGKIHKDLEVKVGVTKVYDIRLTCEENSGNTSNLRSLNYSINIANPGNFDDVVDVEVHNLSNNFTYSFSKDKINLKAFSEESVVLGIIPKENAVAGRYPFQVKAVSETNTSCNRSLPIEIEVDPYYGCEISISKDQFIPSSNNTLAFYPGQDTNITFSVRNLANTPDNIIITSSDMAVVETEILPPVLKMEAFSSGEGKINIKASEDALAGTYYLNLSVRSGFGPVDENSTDRCRIRIDIRPVFELTLSPSTIEREVESGELVCTYWISNKGNSPDEVIVEYFGDSAKWLQFPLRDLTIQPRKDAGLTLNLSVPKNAGSGKHTLEIRVSSEIDDSVFARSVMNITVTENSDGKLLGGLSDNKLVLVVGVILAIVIILIVILIVAVKRRTKKTGEPTPIPNESELGPEPLPPTYEDLYSDLPSVPRSFGEYEHQYESEEYVEYPIVEEIVEEIVSEHEFDGEGIWSEEHRHEEPSVHYAPMEVILPDGETRSLAVEESELTAWDDGMEAEFREMKMPLKSGRKRKRKEKEKGKTASKKKQRDIEGMIKPIYRTDIIDALFDFDEEPAEVSVADWDADDDEEKDIDISDDLEDEGLSGLEWEE